MNEFHAIKKENRVLNCSSNIINSNVTALHFQEKVNLVSDIWTSLFL